MPPHWSRISRESHANDACWLFQRKENQLKNHTPQSKLPPQPITTTTHPPQPYPGVRRLPCGEVREWPNRAVSKTAVLATGPWVRSPPSPPYKLAPADGVPDGSVLFIWFVLFVWFEERKKPNEPDRPDQPVSPFNCAFSFNARLSSTIAKVSRAQYRSRASSIAARSIQSVSTKTIR
jgi:hypothetical protein